MSDLGRGPRSGVRARARQLCDAPSTPSHPTSHLTLLAPTALRALALSLFGQLDSGNCCVSQIRIDLISLCNERWGARVQQTAVSSDRYWSTGCIFPTQNSPRPALGVA